MSAGADDPRVRQLGEYIRLQRQMADLSLRGMADSRSGPCMSGGACYRQVRCSTARYGSTTTAG